MKPIFQALIRAIAGMILIIAANTAVFSQSVPTGLMATAVSATEVHLAWNSVTDATSYQVYSCSNDSIVTVAETEFSVKELNPSTNYSYKIKAVFQDGSSGFTSCSSATTLSQSTQPEKFSEDYNKVKKKVKLDD